MYQGGGIQVEFKQYPNELPECLRRAIILAICGNVPICISA